MIEEVDDLEDLVNDNRSDSTGAKLSLLVREQIEKFKERNDISTTEFNPNQSDSKQTPVQN